MVVQSFSSFLNSRGSGPDQLVLVDGSIQEREVRGNPRVFREESEGIHNLCVVIFGEHGRRITTALVGL